MTYRDRKQVKAGDGIKCRLSEHDEDRLREYVEAVGGQPGVTIRELVIEGLDRRSVPYSDPAQNAAMQERLAQMEVSDAIRSMRREIESRHLNDDRPDNAVNH